MEDLLSNAKNTKTDVSTHIDMAGRLLTYALTKCFGKPCMQTLIQRSKEPQVVLDFAMALSEAMHSFHWKKNTAVKMMCVTKAILRLTNIDSYFLAKLRLLYDEGTRATPAVQVMHQIIGKKHTPAARSRIESWVKELREHTKNRATLSLRNVVMFFTHTCVPAFGLDVEQWQVPTTWDELRIVRQVCKGTQARRKYKWLQLFIRHALCSPHILVTPLPKTTQQTQEEDGEEPAIHDQTDHHRISSKDLDKIYEAARATGTREEMLYLLMISTGMRIGGAARIRTLNVVKIEGEVITMLTSGRTLEKNRKWFQFSMLPRIQELILKWVREERPSDPSPYLFPGKYGGFLTTTAIRANFHAVCSTAGLVKSMEHHPHALRHSYAHILLEQGNTPEIVSKLLGHTSVSTTEEYYIKENAMQLLQRANVPWLKTQVPEQEPLPSFLRDVSMTEEEKREKNKARQRPSHKIKLCSNMLRPNREGNKKRRTS